MNIFLDTEFTGLTQNAKLISVALIDEHNRAFYAEFSDTTAEDCNDWVKANVLTQLEYNNKPSIWQERNEQFWQVRGDSNTIRIALEEFLSSYQSPITFWADNHAYDWVLFCQLWGGAINSFFNKRVHYIVLDLATLLYSHQLDIDTKREDIATPTDYPFFTHTQAKHNALWDAAVCKACWYKLTQGLPF